MRHALIEHDPIDIHRSAWSKFRRDVYDSPAGEVETFRGIPPVGRLRVSIEDQVWRNGNDWVSLIAKRPKQRRVARGKRTHPATDTGTVLW